MSIDQLICDLIQEDQFKAKYTSRQRSIFCNNMYTKVQRFVKEANREHLDRIEALEEELEVARNDLEHYKKEYQELKKNQPVFYLNLFTLARFALYILYLWFMWNHYKVKAEKSIKDTNSTSEDPYRIE